MKRTFAVVFLLVMLFSVSAFALPVQETIETAQEIEESAMLSGETACEYVKNEDGATLRYCDTTETSVTVISHNGPNSPVTRIGEYAFFTYNSTTNLVSVILPDTITSIGEGAFYDCSKLESIYIPESVTSIEAYAFSGCPNLTIHCAKDSYAHTYAINNNKKFDFNLVVAQGECGENLTWSLYGDNKLVISGTGDMTDYSYEPTPWSDYTVETVIIEDGVTSIGDYAFGSCYDLKSVDIPYSVTSIGERAFEYCSSLKNISIPTSITSIQDGTFEGCSSLEQILIPASIRSIGEAAFGQCEKLLLVIIPTSVESIGNYAFAECSKLEYIYIPTSVRNFGWDIFSGSEKVLIGVEYEGCSAQEYAFENYVSYMIAAAPIIESGVSGEYLSWIHRSGVGYEIYGTGDMTDYTDTYSSPWDNYYNWYDSEYDIDITDGVTSIGDYAFSNTTKVNEIQIFDSVTDIGYGAFYNSNIRYIEIPDSVTNISEAAFGKCSNLNGIYIYNNSYYLTDENGVLFDKDKTLLLASPSKNSFDSYTIPDSVTRIGDAAFSCCTYLKSLTIPKSVAQIGSDVFYGIDDITLYVYKNSYAHTYAQENNINFELIEEPETNANSGTCGENLTWEFDESTGVLTISGTGAMTDFDHGTTPWFDYADSIISVIFQGNVTSIGDYAFYNCTSLESVEIPGNVKIVGDYAFYNCSALANLEIKNGVESIGNRAFRNCASLTSVVIPGSVATVGERAFYGCTGIANVELLDGVLNISAEAFSNCTALESMIVPASVEQIGEDFVYGADNITVYGYKDSYIQTYSADNNIRFICLDQEDIIAQGECGENLTWILYENGTLKIEGEGDMYDFDETRSYTSPWNAQGYTDYITNLDIGDKVTSVGVYAFRGCKNITSIDLPNSITKIGSFAFRSCKGLVSIDIPDTVTSIGDNAFYVCWALESIKIPSSLTVLEERVFSDCTSLTEVVIPEGVATIGNYAFYNCNKVESFEISDSVTSIGDYAFYNCTSLANIELPANITTIGSRAFRNCTSLTEIVIPYGITSIGDRAFRGCTNLVEIKIPSSVTTIGEEAFLDCSNVIICCYSETQAYTYAVTNDIAYKLLNPAKVDAAQIRTTNPQGLRYAAYIETAQEGCEYGYIVALESALTAKSCELKINEENPGYNGTAISGKTPEGARYVGAVAIKGNVSIIYSTTGNEFGDKSLGDGLYFTTVLNNIPESQYTTKFVGRPYIKTAEGDYFYGETITRSIYEVAKAIPEDERDEYIWSIIFAVEGEPEPEIKFDDTFTNVESLFDENANTVLNPNLPID